MLKMFSLWSSTMIFTCIIFSQIRHICMCLYYLHIVVYQHFYSCALSLSHCSLTVDQYIPHISIFFWFSFSMISWSLSLNNVVPYESILNMCYFLVILFRAWFADLISIQFQGFAPVLWAAYCFQWEGC